MDRIKSWFWHLGFAAVAAGALLSRDACLGGAKRPDPPPDPTPAQSAALAAPPQTATAAPTATQSFAAPP
jgi:hypothetical protein